MKDWLINQSDKKMDLFCDACTIGNLKKKPLHPIPKDSSMFAGKKTGSAERKMRTVVESVVWWRRADINAVPQLLNKACTAITGARKSTQILCGQKKNLPTNQNQNKMVFIRLKY